MLDMIFSPSRILGAVREILQNTACRRFWWRFTAWERQEALLTDVG